MKTKNRKGYETLNNHQKIWLRALFLSSLAAVNQFAEGANWPPAQNELSFEPWWTNSTSHPAFLAISRTLVKVKASCPEFSWSESKDFESVYLVACVHTDGSATYRIISTDTKREYSVDLNLLSEKPGCPPRYVGKCDPAKLMNKLAPK